MTWMKISVERPRECVESDHEAELPSPQVREAPQNVKSPDTSISISETCSHDLKSRLSKKKTKEARLETTMSTTLENKLELSP